MRDYLVPYTALTVWSINTDYVEPYSKDNKGPYFQLQYSFAPISMLVFSNTIYTYTHTQLTPWTSTGGIAVVYPVMKQLIYITLI